MPQKEQEKLSSKTRRNNRGRSTLEGMEAVTIEEKKIPETWKSFRNDLISLYEKEMSSPTLKRIKERVGWEDSEPGTSISAASRTGNYIRQTLRRVRKAFFLIFAPRVIKQERFNAEIVTMIQRLIDQDKQSNDIISNKIDQMEDKFDALINEIVHKYLVNFTGDLIKRMDILYRRLDENFISHDVEIERIQQVLQHLQKGEHNIKNEFKYIRSLLGAQRRAFEDTLADAAKLESSYAKPEVEMKSSLRTRDIDYVIFENCFRGSPELIKERQLKYLDYFKDKKSVLDIACGRGEFLEIMKENNINAEGIDLNDEMVKVCRDKGLKVAKADALQFLNKKTGKYDGIFCSNLVEHLEYDEIRSLASDIRKALIDDGLFVVETVNPESLNIFANAFYLDLTHIRPLHPLGLEALLESQGFYNMKIIRFTEIEEDGRLEEVENENDLSLEFRNSIAACNRNFQRLNNLLYGYQEYGIISYKMPKIQKGE